MNILFEQIFARSFDAKRKFERNNRIYIKIDGDGGCSTREVES